MSTLNVNNINEYTTGDGVTVDGVLIKDGSIASTAISGQGLTLIKNQSYSSVNTSGTDFDNVFTTTYDNYLFQFNDITYGTANEFLRFRFRTGGASGSDATLDTYTYAYTWQDFNNDASGDRGANTGNTADYGWIHWWANSGVGSSYAGWSECKFRNPNKATNTFQKQESVEYYNGNYRRADVEYRFPENTQFTGIRLETSGGNNFSCNVRLYGYNL